MTDKKSGDMSGGDTSSSPGKAIGSTPLRKDGDNSLSSLDHRILENAIRGRVPGLIGAGQTKFSARPDSHGMPPELDTRLHPELDPVARQLPGTEKAVTYRDMFMQSLVDPDPRRNRDMISELQRSGIPMHTLAIQLFAPVAARLGTLWCDDDADFLQVAVASMRLGMIINHLSHVSERAVPNREKERRVLLARTRGAMHTIGVAIVASCFRDMGWVVDGGLDIELDDDLYMRLSSTPYHLLGISVGRVDEVAECSEAIGRIHSSRKTTGMKIAVGGPAVNMYPEAFAGIGADIVARSALVVMQFADRIAS